jgi:hypothetical protein
MKYEAASGSFERCVLNYANDYRLRPRMLHSSVCLQSDNLKREMAREKINFHLDE